MLLLASAELLRGGLPVGARSRLTFPRELPGSSASASPFRRPSADGAVTQTALPDEPWSGLCGDWAGSPRERGWLRRGGCTRQGAQSGRAGLDARRLQHHGQVARSLRPARPAASPQGVMPPPPLPSSSRSVHPATFKPAFPRRLRSLHRASCSPGNVLPGCCAGTQENNGSGPSTQSALFSRHLNPGTPALRLLGPAGVSRSQTAPFSSQPTQGLRCRLTRQHAESRVRPRRSTIRLQERWSPR